MHRPMADLAISGPSVGMRVQVRVRNTYGLLVTSQGQRSLEQNPVLGSMLVLQRRPSSTKHEFYSQVDMDTHGSEGRR